MNTSILSDVKNAIGFILGDDFDSQILELINLTILPLTQIGCIRKLESPITSETAWEDVIIPPPKGDTYNVISAVKTYITLKVKPLFDTSIPSNIVQIYQQATDEALWRLEVDYING